MIDKYLNKKPDEYPEKWEIREGSIPLFVNYQYGNNVPTAYCSLRSAVCEADLFEIALSKLQ